MRRGAIVTAMAVMLVAAMAGPAMATKAPAPNADPDDGHKITICHATRSLSNPYVEITIDVAAWNDPSDPKHHGDHHTRTKDGVTWSDYKKVEGEDCSLDVPPPGGVCGLTEVDYVVDFGVELRRAENGGPQTQTVSGLDIAAGTYQVILASSDTREDASQEQDNEQWRAVFNGALVSGYSDDLEDLVMTAANTTNVGTMDLPAISSITAEHWSVAMVSNSPDSVVPVCIGLIAENGGPSF